MLPNPLWRACWTGGRAYYGQPAATPELTDQLPPDRSAAWNNRVSRDVSLFSLLSSSQLSLNQRNLMILKTFTAPFMLKVPSTFIIYWSDKWETVKLHNSQSRFNVTFKQITRQQKDLIPTYRSTLIYFSWQNLQTLQHYQTSYHCISSSYSWDNISCHCCKISKSTQIFNSKWKSSLDYYLNVIYLSLHLISNLLFIFILKTCILRFAAEVTKSIAEGSSWQEVNAKSILKKSD